MTSLADLRLWMEENTHAFMPSVSFKTDVEEHLNRKISDADWEQIVQNAEMDLDEVNDIAFSVLLKHTELVVGRSRREWVSVDDWEAHYSLLPNYLRDDASWGGDGEQGCLFETFGLEWDFVCRVPENRVWSYVDAEEGGTIVVAGRIVHPTPIGYLVSLKPWDKFELVVVS